MPLSLTEPKPFREAVDSLSRTSLVPTRLGSAAIARRWPYELRESAFFSARVSELEALQAMKGRLEETLNFTLSREAGRSFMDRGKFIAEMRPVMRQHGLDFQTGERMSNPASRQRLGFIYDFQVEKRFEGGRHAMGQDPDILDEFPCLEFKRLQSRQNPRNDDPRTPMYWNELWAELGGRFYHGRMIARKDWAGWRKLNHFGFAHGPWHYGSGMGTVEIDRDEAEALGVIQPGEVIEPDASVTERLVTEPGTDTTSMSVKHLGDEYRQNLRDHYGDQLTISADGVATLDHGLMDRLVDEAINVPQPRTNVRLGQATAKTIRLAQELGVQMQGARLQLDAGSVRKILKDHGPKGILGPGTGETRKGQVPVQLSDFRFFPELWRNPEEMRLGKERGGKPTLMFFSSDFGWLWQVVWQRAPESNLWQIVTAYKSPAGKTERGNDAG